jgi:hypothetical protein
MKSSRDNQPPFPVRDYSLAVQSAVSWLGDRYLLAAPIAARPSHWQGRFAAGRSQYTSGTSISFGTGLRE